MMQGHAPQLKQQHSATLTNEDKNKENSTPMASSIKQSLTSSHRHACGRAGYDGEAHGMPKKKGVQEQLPEEHIHMNENNHLAREEHECTMSALLVAVCGFFLQ